MRVRRLTIEKGLLNPLLFDILKNKIDFNLLFSDRSKDMELQAVFLFKLIEVILSGQLQLEKR